MICHIADVSLSSFFFKSSFPHNVIQPEVSLTTPASPCATSELIYSTVCGHEFLETMLHEQRVNKRHCLFNAVHRKLYTAWLARCPTNSCMQQMHTS